MRFSEELKQKISDKLLAKGAPPKCTRCEKSQLGIVDGIGHIEVPTAAFSSTMKKPQTIPCVLLICNNCGYVAMHAVGILELSFGEVKAGVIHE